MNETGRGTGDITLALAGDDKIGFVHLWPHSRPWRLAHPEPMLRCVPNAKEVGQILSRAWSASTGLAVSTAPQAAAPLGVAPSWPGRSDRSGSGLTQGA
jgi:hypothetical protein